MSTKNISDEYTIQGFMDHKTTEEFSYINFSIVEPCESGEILFTIKNVIDDYLEELLEICKDVPLTREDQLKYFYRPWLLAYDIYGNSELYWIIMLVNDIPTPNEFEGMTKIKLPYADQLDELLSQILEAESPYLAKNRSNTLKI